MFQPNTDAPNDYKALMSVGPFSLAPGQTILLDIAYAAGQGLDEFLDNAAFMKLIYNGTWVNMDKDSETGIDGREAIFIGTEASAKDGVSPDPCADAEKVKVAVRDTLWINGDCCDETGALELSGLLQGDDAVQGLSARASTAARPRSTGSRA